MKGHTKLTKFVAHLLVIMLTVTTVILGVPPGAASAENQTIDNMLKNLESDISKSRPGGLVIQWYDAKRSAPGLSSLFNMGSFSSANSYGSVGVVESLAAFRSKDRSHYLGREEIDSLAFDMGKWVSVGQDNSANGTRDILVWGEVSGYIKSTYAESGIYWTDENSGYVWLGDSESYLPSIGTPANYELEIDGKLIAGNWTEIPSTLVPSDQSQYIAYDKFTDSPGEFKTFRLRIGCAMKASDGKSRAYNETIFNIKNGFSDFLSPIPAGSLYSSLALQDMKRFFKLDTDKYTLYLDPDQHKTFPADDYVYGICSGDPQFVDVEDCKTLQLGTNELEQTDGKVFIKNKYNAKDYIVINSLSAVAVNGLKVAERTPNAATLTWSAPSGGMPVIDYDIYRKEIGYTKEITSFDMRMVSTGGNLTKVGSTKELSFLDLGIRQDMIYEYTVTADYNLIPDKISAPVRTDSVLMTALPGTPANLRIEKTIQGQKNDLVLRWDETPPLDPPMAYNIYRKLTKAAAPVAESSPGSVIVISGLLNEPPKLIGRSVTTEFIDSGLDYKDTCEYYVQASSAKGYESFISDPLTVVVSVMAPTAPGNLKIGNVLRNGEDVKYDFPDHSGSKNAVLGSRREVALQWDPSKDNSKVVGYNIYRKGCGKDLKTYEYWEESERLVGTTSDNTFIDSDLKLGGDYIYTVEAIDDEDNRTKSQTAEISTMKSALSDLAIKNGTKSLIPSPAFAYFNTDYKLDVANEVEAIRLIPQKADSLSEVVINGVGVDGSIDLALDPGENVIPIEVRQSSVTQEIMNYTLTVNRVNLEDLPALKLSDSGTAIKEGDSYKASGSSELQTNRDWKGTVDYGDGTGIQPLRPDKDGSFALQHQYLDNGKYKVDVAFRYLDKGLVEETLEAVVENVIPVLTGIKDEYTVKEGDLLIIDGIVADPGQDNWVVTGYAEGLGNKISTEVMVDRTFRLGETVYDNRPEYDMLLKVMDGDDGASSKNVNIKVENVAPDLQANGVSMVVVRGDFIGSGSFADPGQDTWQATVDYGDGSGIQPLNLKADKTFDLKHVYNDIGNYSITVRVQDNDGASDSVSFPVKVKLFVTSLEMGEDAAINEGDTLKREILVLGFKSFVKDILVDYGDGTGEKSVALTAANSSASASPGFNLAQILPTVIGNLSLEHTYKDNGTYTVKAKIVDVDGDVYEDSFNAEVVNIAPTIQLFGGTIFAGDAFTCRGTITDPGDDNWTVEISSSYGFQPQTIDLGNGKTFSFDRTYNKSGLYEINAVVRDNNGGIGYGAGQLTVNRRPSTSVGVSNDATLHSLYVGATLTQNYLSYTETGFDSECLSYTVHGTANILNVTAYADTGATIEYKDDGHSVYTTLLPGTNAQILAGPMMIKVTAEDGVTTREYTISH